MGDEWGGGGSEWAFSDGTLLNDAFRHTLLRSANGGLEEEEFWRSAAGVLEA